MGDIEHEIRCDILAGADDSRWVYRIGADRVARTAVVIGRGRHGKEEGE
jgi:hypothetical protein